MNSSPLMSTNIHTWTAIQIDSGFFIYNTEKDGSGNIEDQELINPGVNANKSLPTKEKVCLLTLKLLEINSLA